MSPATGRFRQLAVGVSLALFMLGVVTIAVVVVTLARRPGLRLRFDATKTRAYSLSEQTRRLLGDLEGDWTVALILEEGRTDRAVRRQIEEVLLRIREAAPNVAVVRVDPADPESLADYERLLADLRLLYHDLVEAYDAALDDGEEAFAELQAFAQVQAGRLERILPALPADDPEVGPLQQRLGLLALMGREGGRVLDQVRADRREEAGRPIPDYDAARSVLAAALGEWGNELYDTSRRFARLLERPDLEPGARSFLSSARGEYETLAQRLANASDPLRRLPPLELSLIGRQLETGQAALVLGPRRAAVIPARQLVPALNLRQGAGGGVDFDQRFRGEQLLGSAIRSLLVERMPLVVLMHDGERSLRSPDQRQSDLVGLATQLVAARYEVKEWIVSRGPPPAADPGQRAVWIVVPSPTGGRADVPGEPRLVAAARSLVEAGEAVLVSLYPSVVGRFGQADPWQAVLDPIGVEADTARVVLETVPVGEGRSELVRGQTLFAFPADHPVTRAVDGQQTYFSVPVPVAAAPAASVNVTPLATIEPSPTRWLAGDWVDVLTSRESPEAGPPIETPVDVAVAVERPHPVERGTQRCLVVGSGGWLMSNTADLVVGVGGERVALVNPGNYELALASVAWLAQMDELIAASPIGAAVARLDGIGTGARRWWTAVVLVVMPGGTLVLGTGVWLARRRF